ncbi:MAG: cytochrome c3 family protein [Acidobacteria bacterium]|nr:cytochrome c3 family protein [Acidobacteriota bacterium]
MQNLKIKTLILLSCLIGSLMLIEASMAQQQTPGVAQQKPVDYEKFTHKSHTGSVKVPGTGAFRDLKCDSCHDRPADREISGGIVQTTPRNKQLSLKFPGHKACAECHIAQFTTRPQQTCTICHETRNGLNARPPQRDFPQRSDFNALFDAKQHELHAGYILPQTGKKTDCGFCHKQDQRPAVLTIASHPECYACHSPGSQDQKGKLKSGCIVCHTQVVPAAQPFSAKYVSRAYGAKFTHKSHVEHMGNRCDMCHTISAGYNQPAPTSLKVKQHNTTAEKSGRGCFTCHDGGVHFGRKVFCAEPGCEGGGSCQKCHTRNDFKVFPSS